LTLKVIQTKGKRKKGEKSSHFQQGRRGGKKNQTLARIHCFNTLSTVLEGGIESRNSFLPRKGRGKEGGDLVIFLGVETSSAFSGFRERGKKEGSPILLFALSGRGGGEGGRLHPMRFSRLALASIAIFIKRKREKKEKEKLVGAPMQHPGEKGERVVLRIECWKHDHGWFGNPREEGGLSFRLGKREKGALPALAGKNPESALASVVRGKKKRGGEPF